MFCFIIFGVFQNTEYKIENWYKTEENQGLYIGKGWCGTVDHTTKQF